ncbi:hypothetical protein McanMca71_007876 [Microsporum canis]
MVPVEYCIKLLEVSEKVYGKDHSHNFAVINQLATLCLDHEMWQEAHSPYLRSLFGRLNTLDEEHKDTLITLQGLGAVKAILKDASQARPLLERADIGFENLKTPPKDKTITLLTLNSLATVYFELGMFHDAETLLPWILEITDELQKQHCEYGGKALRLLADFYTKNHCYQKAMEVFKSLVGQYKALKTSTIDSMYILSKAGDCFMRLCRLDDAEDTFKLMALMASSNNTPAYQVYQSLSADFLRDIRDIMQEVARERDSWGLNNPLECQCGKKQHGFTRSAAQNTLVQQNANWQRTTYTPTVSPAQTPIVKIISERVEIFEKMTLEHESEFPAIRIWIDPSKVVSFGFIPPDIRISLANDPSLPSIEARELQILPILEGNRDKYLTAAMGSEPMASLTKRYTKDTGIHKSPDMQFPDQDLSDYSQMTCTRKFGLSLGVVMIIWER